MQKIAYSTLAIATPLILTGCNDEESKNDDPKPEDPDFATCPDRETYDECYAGPCEWKEEQEDATCEAVENFRETLAAASTIAECDELNAVMAQSCGVDRQCSDITFTFGEETEARANMKLSFADLKASPEGYPIIFHKPDSVGDFTAESGNLNDLCTGYMLTNENPEVVEICPSIVDGECANVAFDCGLNNDDVVRGDFTLTEEQVNAPTNVVYDKTTFDLCQREETCGMEFAEGVCVAIEDFCAQPFFTEGLTVDDEVIFTSGQSCPAGWEKSNVGFTTVDTMAVKTKFAVCEYEIVAEDIISERTCTRENENEEGRCMPEEVCRIEDNDEEGVCVLQIENSGCKTVAGLDLATCASTPYPSFGQLYHDGADETRVVHEDMCPQWLADEFDWTGNTFARRTYACPEGEDFNGEVCVDAVGAETGSELVLSDRNCKSLGSATIEEDQKECALPRAFTCDPTLGDDEDLTQCANVSEAICTFDDGFRAFCVDPPSNDEDDEKPIVCIRDAEDCPKDFTCRFEDDKVTEGVCVPETNVAPRVGA